MLPAYSLREICKVNVLSSFCCFLMGEAFMGGVHPPSHFFFISYFVLQGTTKFFSVLSKLSQASRVKISIFQASRKWFPWHPKGEGVHPPINLEVFFQTY